MGTESRLTAHWVVVTANDGSRRLEMRWASAETIRSMAEAAAREPRAALTVAS